VNRVNEQDPVCAGGFDPGIMSLHQDRLHVLQAVPAGLPGMKDAVRA
jgi:hypothetical protein